MQKDYPYVKEFLDWQLTIFWGFIPNKLIIEDNNYYN
jgi:hypothetical protein